MESVWGNCSVCDMATIFFFTFYLMGGGCGEGEGGRWETASWGKSTFPLAS